MRKIQTTFLSKIRIKSTLNKCTIFRTFYNRRTSR